MLGEFGVCRADSGPFKLISVVTPIEPDRSLQHEIHIVTFAFDFANRLGNAFGIVDRLVDCVPEAFHQVFELLVHGYIQVLKCFNYIIRRLDERSCFWDLSHTSVAGHIGISPKFRIG